MTTGKVTVQTGQANTNIKIVNENDEQLVAGQGQKLSARLQPGRYIVQVYTSIAHTNQAVNLRSRQNISLHLPLSTPQKFYPIISTSGTSISADSNNLYFIDSSNKKLTKIDDQGNTIVIDNTHTYKKISWESAGVGVGIDTSSNIYAINGASVSPIRLPFSLNPSVSCDVAPNGNLYVSNGQDIFMGTLSGNFKKVYSSGDNYNSSLSANNSGVAFVEKNPSNNTTSAVVVSSFGTRKTEIPGLRQLTWSPDGNYIATATSNRNFSAIYTSSLSLQKSLPNQGAGHLLWYKKNSLLYATGNVLWQYEISNQISKSLMSLPANQSANDLSVDADGDYLYFSTNQQLARTPLRSQSINNKLSLLNTFLPGTAGVCSLDYVNFNHPIITISYPRLDTSPELCVDAAKSQLRYYGLDPNIFQYSVTATQE